MITYTCPKCGGEVEALSSVALRGRRLGDLVRPRVQCTDCKNIFKI